MILTIDGESKRIVPSLNDTETPFTMTMRLVQNLTIISKNSTIYLQNVETSFKYVCWFLSKELLILISLITNPSFAQRGICPQDHFKYCNFTSNSNLNYFCTPEVKQGVK